MQSMVRFPISLCRRLVKAQPKLSFNKEKSKRGQYENDRKNTDRP
jgi:hypothetical protein